MTGLENYKTINRAFSHLPARIKDVLIFRFLYNAKFPEIIHIENTNACNADCLICAREKMTRRVGFMDFELFKKIIDECSGYRDLIREVHLHGFGEPLLDKMICDKISYAKKKGIKKTYFVTNASLLSQDVAKALISSGLDRIKFSFYGATRPTYEKIHRGLEFKAVEENIVNFFNIRGQMKSSTPSVTIQFVPQKDNLEEKAVFRGMWGKFIEKKKGDYIEEFYLHNWINARDYNPVLDRKAVSLKSCAIPFRIIQILYNGDVVPCVFDFNANMIMGNIGTKKIKDIWNNELYEDLRQKHRKKDFKNTTICLNCDQLKGA